jgi:hypothetical protein
VAKPYSYRKLGISGITKAMKFARRWVLACAVGTLAYIFVVAALSALMSKQVCDAHVMGMPYWSTQYTPSLGRYVPWRKLPRFQPGWIISYAAKTGYPSRSFFLNLRADVMGEANPAVVPSLMKLHEEMVQKEVAFSRFMNQLEKLTQHGSEYSNVVANFGTPYQVSTNDNLVSVEHRILVPWAPHRVSSSILGLSILLSNDVVSARAMWWINR